MEDTVSRGSAESISTSDDFVVVSDPEPCLKIPGNGSLDELKNRLNEVLIDADMHQSLNDKSSVQNSDYIKSLTDSEKYTPIEMPASEMLNKQMSVPSSDRIIKNLPVNESTKKVGKTIFYGSIKNRPRSDSINIDVSPTSLNSEEGRSRSSSMPIIVPDGDCTIFNHVTYLGSAAMNAPRSEIEILRNMRILNEHSKLPINVTLSVPTTSEGTVRLYEPDTKNEIASFSIYQIVFCARGKPNSEEASCFAFTCSHGESIETTIFHCHVFRCEISEAVGKVLLCFASAFRRVPKIPSDNNTLQENNSNSVHLFRFDVTLEIKEEDAKGNFNPVPKDKNCFKIRSTFEKKLVISVQQTSNNKELIIERCFGLLICPGRNVKHSDMQLLDMVSMGAGNEGKSYIISGHWDPRDQSFVVLNTVTPKDARVYMTIAVDLVVVGIQEPVRFVIETKAKIFPQNERFWSPMGKKSLNEQFYLRLKEVESKNITETLYEVISLESGTELERRKANMSLSLSPNKSPSIHSISTSGDPETDSDNDEPLLSGSGDVSKDCSEGELDSWADILTKWRQNLKQRPRQLQSLVRKGIPEALRGEVWQLLAGCQDERDIMENYRVLITKESPNEQVILRDINRTFPAHDYFKESGGIGQDALYKISKAYSIYDEEVGYCQGLSFLAAALLLHMPEEQAFCVLVKIMNNYGLRNLFKQGFEELHLKFYQLERLMEEMLPDLFNHFIDMNLEAHMFASQWFLTLFTAKFPLYMVFHILDLYLSEGMDTIFHVALALLKTSRKDLLQLDFEGALKYFRVSLPKRYRSEESARDLLCVAVSIKISDRKLKKFEKEYLTMKEQEAQQEDPIERLERENKRILEANMRLEQENDDLAHELVTSKIQLRNNLDTAEDKAETLNKELLAAKALLVDTEEEKKRLEVEAVQVKDMCRRELERAESDIARNSIIIAEYKQICSQLSERLEKEQSAHKDSLAQLKLQIQKCETCCQLFSTDGTTLASMLIGQSGDTEPADPRLVAAEVQIRELELELAQTKLALVESECKNQDLTHQLNAALGELQASKNTWFHKTLTTLKEATKKETKEAREKELKETL